MSKITIDRTVVEQALEALFMYKPMVTGVTFQHGLDAMQALRAALEQPKPLPPTVWRFVPTTMTDAMAAVDKELRHAVPWIRWEAILAAAPQPPTLEQSQPKREPIPNVMMDLGWELHGSNDPYQSWCMAVEWTERAHGIGGEA